FGPWILLLQVASRCEQRGLLVNDFKPISIDDLEIKTDMPAARFKEAIPILIDIGWVEEVEYPDNSGATSEQLRRASEQLRKTLPTGQYITEQDKTVLKTCPSPEGSDVFS